MTIARKPTAPVEPLGVARNRFAVCPVVNVTAKTPAVVTGDPVTVKTLGTVKPTLVTVPGLPEPEQLPHTGSVPLDVRQFPVVPTPRRVAAAEC